jgi:hypothetical protein
MAHKSHMPIQQKNLGMTLDTKLQWKEHIKMKHDELNIKIQ